MGDYLDTCYTRDELYNTEDLHNNWDNEIISKLSQESIDSLPSNSYNEDIQLDKDAPF